MRRSRIICSLLLLTLFASVRRTDPQTPSAQSDGPYQLNVAVDEVILTFHAADAKGLPVNDLKLDELSLLDNGTPPRKVLAFQALQNRPIRAGILMDKSESMEQDLPHNREISARYIQQLLRQQTDQAFVMDFASLSEIAQSWTSDPAALATGLRKFTAVRSRPEGTVLFDAIYRACLNQFGHIDHAGSGNFILLFSDGEDNSSRASFEEAVRQCQHTNTAIYSFRAAPKSSFFSEGPKTLAQLSLKTGGRVFYNDDSETDIDRDLHIIEGDLRDQYRLIYQPADLKHDSSFHRIELKAPERVYTVVIRSGYYAPRH